VNPKFYSLCYRAINQCMVLIDVLNKHNVINDTFDSTYSCSSIFKKIINALGINVYK